MAASVYFLFGRGPDEVGSQEVFQIGGIPHSIIATSDAVWVTDLERKLVLKVDPSTGRVEERAQLPFVPGEIVVAGDSLWVGAILQSSIARLELTDAEVISTIEIGTTPQSLTTDGERVWVAAFDDGLVQPVDASTGRLLDGAVKDKEAFFSDLSWGFDALWIADVVDNTVSRVAASGSEDSVDVGDSPTGIVAGEGYVWTTNFNGNTVTRIDPETLDAGRPILVGGKPGGIATGAGYVWITRPEDDALVRVDASVGSWTGELIDVGADPQGVSVLDRSVWVANQGDGSITRIDLD
jgi:streptogramin lyase